MPFYIVCVGRGFARPVIRIGPFATREEAEVTARILGLCADYEVVDAAEVEG